MSEFEGINADTSVKSTNGRKITKHHILPRSRGGIELKDNIVKIPRRYHESWHVVFGNCTPEEAIDLIERIFLGKKRKRRKKRWNHIELYDLQLKIQQETIRREKKEEKKIKKELQKK